MHDPRLIRFNEVITRSHELGTKDASYVLGISYASIQRMCANGEIEAAWISTTDRVTEHNERLAARWKREGRPGAPPLKKRRHGQHRSYTITAPALLAHLITHTHPRSILMDSIRELLPAWEAFAQRIASGATVIEARQQTAKATKSAKHAAPNVLPFDPACDLFPTLTPATSSAA
jgi:hypothetical protein